MAKRWRDEKLPHAPQNTRPRTYLFPRPAEPLPLTLRESETRSLSTLRTARRHLPGNGRTGQEVSGPASGGWLDCASFQSRSRLGQIRFRFCSGLSGNRSAKSFWGWGSGTPLKIKTYRRARSGFLSSHRAPGEGKPRVYSSHYPIRVAG